MRGFLVGVAIIAGGTWIGAPTLSLLGAGVVVGAAWPGRAARTVAAAAIAAWGGVLVVYVLRGYPVLALGRKLGGAMGLPGWAPFLATLLYPAVLAASAAWLAQLASPRRRAYDPPAAERASGLT